MARLDRRRFFVNGNGSRFLPGDSHLFDQPGVYPVNLKAGTYGIYMFGAQGGSFDILHAGSPGGYARGTLTLTKRQTLYVVVGGQGNKNSATGGYNGGGGLSEASPYITTGGGASDLCLTEPLIKYNGVTQQYERDRASLYSRIMVAPGGAGRTYKHITNFKMEDGIVSGGYKQVPINAYLDHTWGKMELKVVSCNPVGDSNERMRYDIKAEVRETWNTDKVGCSFYNKFDKEVLPKTPWCVLSNDHFIGGHGNDKSPISVNDFKGAAVTGTKVNPICIVLNDESLSSRPCYIVDTVADYTHALTAIEATRGTSEVLPHIDFYCEFSCYRDKPIAVGDVLRTVFLPCRISQRADVGPYEFFGEEVSADEVPEEIEYPITINEYYFDSGAGYGGGGLTGFGELAGSFDDSKGNSFGQSEIADISDGKFAVPGGGGWYCGKNHVFSPGEEIKGGGGSGFAYTNRELVPDGFTPTNEYLLTDVLLDSRSDIVKPWIFGYDYIHPESKSDPFHMGFGDGVVLITRIN